MVFETYPLILISLLIRRLRENLSTDCEPDLGSQLVVLLLWCDRGSANLIFVVRFNRLERMTDLPRLLESRPTTQKPAPVYFWLDCAEGYHFPTVKISFPSHRSLYMFNYYNFTNDTVKNVSNSTYNGEINFFCARRLKLLVWQKSKVYSSRLRH